MNKKPKNKLHIQYLNGGLKWLKSIITSKVKSHPGLKDRQIPQIENGILVSY